MPTCFVAASTTFLPKASLIASISQEILPTVTTTTAHLLTTKQFVRFKIPNTYGMVQLNNVVGIIAVTGPTTFLVDVNTVQFDAFVVPSAPPPAVIPVQCAQVVPVGEHNSTFDGATHNVL